MAVAHLVHEQGGSWVCTTGGEAVGTPAKSDSGSAAFAAVVVLSGGHLKAPAASCVLAYCSQCLGHSSRLRADQCEIWQRQALP
jgi:hypothetical protein